MFHLSLTSFMAWGLGIRAMKSWLWAQPTPLSLIALLDDTWVFGKRPFFFNRMRTQRKSILNPIIAADKRNTFNIIQYFCMQIYKEKDNVCRTRTENGRRKKKYNIFLI